MSNGGTSLVCLVGYTERAGPRPCFGTDPLSAVYSVGVVVVGLAPTESTAHGQIMNAMMIDDNR